MNNYVNVISKINISDQTNILLCEIIGIENYFYHEIKERKSYIKRTCKQYRQNIDKILLVHSI